MTRYRRRPPRHPDDIAPTYAVEPVRCAQCGHAELMHRRESDGRCLSRGCGCTEYREVTQE